MKITIVGSGYVGLVAGTCFAEGGNDVMCLDIDERKVKRLKSGEVPIYEPGLHDLFERNTREKRLQFTTDFRESVEHAHIYFLCLPTPPMEDGSADVKYVRSAVNSILENLKEVQKPSSHLPIFVLKSTVPLGTNQKVRREIADKYEGEFDVVSNPEFLKEGAAVKDFMFPDRVVIGAESDASFELLTGLYEPFCRTGAPILRMDPASAELTKYAANCFLATKISFMNEVAKLCDLVGADVEQVRVGISKDQRIGHSFLFAGLGYGGSCFPKDTRALVNSAKKYGSEMSIVEAAEDVNNRQKSILINKILNYFDGDVEGRTFGFWGLAFKPRTDDIREAPALVMIEQLLQKGARVKAFDPEAMKNVQTLFGDRIEYGETMYDVLDGVDGLVLATEWNEFRSPDWQRVLKLMKTPLLFDGRNIYQPEKIRSLGFSYTGIGRP